MVNLLFYRKFNARMPLVSKKNFKFHDESCSLSKVARMSSTYLK